MYEYNRAVKNVSSRKPKAQLTASIFDDSVAAGMNANSVSGSVTTKSSSGKSCWRCKADIDISWRYCIVCGNAVNLDVNNPMRPISPIVNGNSYSLIFTYLLIH